MESNFENEIIHAFTLKANDINKNKLFGFSGKYASGKDAFADLLRKMIKEYCPIASIEYIPFALALKRFVGMMDERLNFCITDEEKSQKPNTKICQVLSFEHILSASIPKSIFEKYKLGDKLEFLKQECEKIFQTSETMGRVLQRVGTALFRDQIGKNFWIDCWKTEALKAIDSGNFVFCTDVRFPNEKIALEQLGGTIVRIYSDPEIRKSRIKTIRDKNHESETALDHITDWEFYIINNSNLDELKKQVEIVFHSLAIF